MSREIQPKSIQEEVSEMVERLLRALPRGYEPGQFWSCGELMGCCYDVTSLLERLSRALSEAQATQKADGPDTTP